MSGAREALVARAEALWRDLRIGAVREWKAKTGGLAIGFLPVYAPREVLHAQGVLPVALMGAGDDLEIIRGDAYYQSYICHLPRSTVEMALDGSYDPLDGVLFPATCDVIRNLSGIWRMQFPGKLVRYLDVPQTFDPARGGRFWRGELEALAADLASRGARPLEPAALRRSISVFDAHRRLVRGLYDLRRDEPHRVPTHELYSVLRAGNVLPVEEHAALLAAYRAEVLGGDARPAMDLARVVLVGSFCEQPPLGLVKTLERSGCHVVDDDFAQVQRWFRHDVLTGPDDPRDPLDALVEAFLSDSIDHPTRWTPHGDKGADLVERVKASRAGGVVFCAPSFCDPALLDQPMAVAAIERAGIPWTAFKYAENGGQFQAIREQAGTFADSIRLWSAA